MIEKLFDRFDQDLAAKGYMARGGRSPEDNRKQDLTRTCALEHCSRCPYVCPLLTRFRAMTSGSKGLVAQLFLEHHEG